MICNPDGIITSIIGTLIGVIIGAGITFLVSKHYSKKTQTQIEENAKVLFNEIRQVLSELRKSHDLGACLNHDDHGLAIKTAWGGSGAACNVIAQGYGSKNEHHNDRDED